MNENTGHHATGAHDARTACVLLVEDDAVSAAFLSEAIAALPAKVVIAATLADARRIAATQRFDLWLIDANLPDGSGAELLGQLRAHELDTPAIAHTAETARTILDALIDAGFEEVLIKPLSVAILQGAIRRFAFSDDSADRADHRFAPSQDAVSDAGGEKPACGKLPLWDDDAALRALNGQRAHVVLMRRLFRDELPKQAATMTAARQRNDDATLRTELHKLSASAGFVGAARLAAAARDLQAQPETADTRRRFDGALRDTLDAFPEEFER